MFANKKVTVFDSIYVLIQKIQDFFCYLEYLYETTLIPVRDQSEKLHLKFAASKFGFKLSRAFTSSITKKKIKM